MNAAVRNLLLWSIGAKITLAGGNETVEKRGPAFNDKRTMDPVLQVIRDGFLIQSNAKSTDTPRIDIKNRQLMGSCVWEKGKFILANEQF